MKVILKKDHDTLGDEGQIVEVKNGFARNFLIPNGYAASATASNLKSYEEIKKQKSRKVLKLTEETQKIASEIARDTITIAVKTGEEDRIFGSVTAQMIHDALNEKGFGDVDKKKIIIKEQIKSLGEHEVEIKLQHSVIAKIKVNVVKENAEVITEQEVTVTESVSEN